MENETLKRLNKQMCWGVTKATINWEHFKTIKKFSEVVLKFYIHDHYFSKIGKPLFPFLRCLFYAFLSFVCLVSLAACPPPPLQHSCQDWGREIFLFYKICPFDFMVIHVMRVLNCYWKWEKKYLAELILRATFKKEQVLTEIHRKVPKIYINWTKNKRKGKKKPLLHT